MTDEIPAKKDPKEIVPEKPAAVKPETTPPLQAKPVQAASPAAVKPETTPPLQAKPVQAASPASPAQGPDAPAAREAKPAVQEPAAAKAMQHPPASSPEQAKPVSSASDDAEKPGKPAWDAKTLLFNRWDISDAVVSDLGLKSYMNLTPIIVPRTGGKYGPKRGQKYKVPIVERFMNKLMVSGHRGKKHKLTSGHHVGKIPNLYNQVKEAFIIIEKRTSKNPIQVLVTAVENSALLEEVASYRLGGTIARNSVITSPQRRLDIALKHLTQGIYRSSFRSKQSLARVIANDLIAASTNDPKSFAVSERNRIEREAEGAR